MTSLLPSNFYKQLLNLVDGGQLLAFKYNVRGNKDGWVFFISEGQLETACKISTSGGDYLAREQVPSKFRKVRLTLTKGSYNGVAGCFFFPHDGALSKNAVPEEMKEQFVAEVRNLLSVQIEEEANKGKSRQARFYYPVGFFPPLSPVNNLEQTAGLKRVVGEAPEDSNAASPCKLQRTKSDDGSEWINVLTIQFGAPESTTYSVTPSVMDADAEPVQSGENTEVNQVSDDEDAAWDDEKLWASLDCALFGPDKINSEAASSPKAQVGQTP